MGTYIKNVNYNLGRLEIDFVNSLPQSWADEPIEYTPDQEKQLDAICKRLTAINGHCEWKWMLRGAKTTDFKCPRAQAQHIFLKTVAKMEDELTPPDASELFHGALNMSHIWYRELLFNAYTLKA